MFALLKTMRPRSFAVLLALLLLPRILRAADSSPETTNTVGLAKSHAEARNTSQTTNEPPIRVQISIFHRPSFFEKIEIRYRSRLERNLGNRFNPISSIDHELVSLRLPSRIYMDSEDGDAGNATTHSVGQTGREILARSSPVNWLMNQDNFILRGLGKLISGSVGNIDEEEISSTNPSRRYVEDKYWRDISRDKERAKFGIKLRKDPYLYLSYNLKLHDEDVLFMNLRYYEFDLFKEQRKVGMSFSIPIDHLAVIDIGTTLSLSDKAKGVSEPITASVRKGFKHSYGFVGYTPENNVFALGFHRTF